MGAPARRRRTATDNLIVANDDAADGRIERGLPKSTLRQPERMLHMTRVVQLESAAAQSLSPPSISPIKASKSFVSRKFL